MTASTTGALQTEAVPRAALRLPHVEPGMRVGLFGGSFNPPHAGHVHVSKIAIERLQLDRFWWLVSPGNPLKDHAELARLSKRLALCQAIARHPRIEITAFEASLSFRFTADTLAYIMQMEPAVNFIWVMGADNLGGFHQWKDWRKIAGSMPIAVVDRAGFTLSTRSSPAALALRRWRLDEADAPLLATSRPPAWIFLHGPRSPLSSTALRAASKRQRV